MKLKTVFLTVCATGIVVATIVPLRTQGAVNTLQTQYARIEIDGKGFITSLTASPARNTARSGIRRQ